MLLSHYDDWHQILNHCPTAVALPHESEDAYRQRFDDQLDDFFGRVTAAGQWGNKVSDWPQNFQHEFEATWEQTMYPANYPKTSYWQATTHELLAENVTDAVQKMSLHQAGPPPRHEQPIPASALARGYRQQLPVKLAAESRAPQPYSPIVEHQLSRKNGFHGR